MCASRRRGGPCSRTRVAAGAAQKQSVHCSGQRHGRGESEGVTVEHALRQYQLAEPSGIPAVLHLTGARGSTTRLVVLASKVPGALAKRWTSVMAPGSAGEVWPELPVVVRGSSGREQRPGHPASCSRGWQGLMRRCNDTDDTFDDASACVFLSILHYERERPDSRRGLRDACHHRSAWPGGLQLKRTIEHRHDDMHDETSVIRDRRHIARARPRTIMSPGL